MGMPATPYYTADMVRELTDEDRHWPRCETVYGELLVTPADRFPHVEREALVWAPEGASAPFVLPLAELVRPL